MATRVVTGLINRPNGEPWASAKIGFELRPGSYDEEAQYPADRHLVYADADGEFSTELWVNEEGAIPTEYSVRYPSGEEFSISVEAGASVDIAVLRAAYPGPPPEPTPTQEWIDYIAEQIDPLEAADAALDSRLDTVESTQASHAARITAAESDIDALQALTSGMAASVTPSLTSEENIPLAAAVSSFNSSTFSGWGGPLGSPQNFDRVKLRVRAFDAGFIPSQLRLQIREGSESGALLADKTIAIAPPHNVVTEITVTLDALVVNAGDAQLWAAFWTNGRTGSYSGSQDTYFPSAPRGRYSTSGNITSLGTDPISSQGIAVSWFQAERSSAVAVADPTTPFANAVSRDITSDFLGRNPDSFGRWNMKDWRAQLGKIRAGTASSAAVLGLFGDSWVASVVTYFATLLTTEYTFGGAGYVGIGMSHGAADTTKATLARSGTWTDSDQQATSRGIDIAHANSTVVASKVTVTSVANCTRFVLHYLKQANGGTLRWRVDGGSWTSVATANATNLHATVDISGLSDATHTLEVEVEVAGTAGVTLMGVDVQRSSGARVHRLGNGGLSSTQAIAVDPVIWQASLTALGCNAVGIILGTNDHTDNVPVATFRANMVTLINRIRWALPRCDVFLIAPSDNDLTGKLHTIAEYSAVMANLAIDRGIAYVDLDRVMGDYVDANARGLMLNGTHLNANGSRLAAGITYDQLLRVS